MRKIITNNLPALVLLIVVASCTATFGTPVLSNDDLGALAYVRSVRGDRWGRPSRVHYGDEPSLRSRMHGVMRREELAVGTLVARRVKAADPEYVGLDAAIQLRQLAFLCARQAVRSRQKPAIWAAFVVRAEKLSRLATTLADPFSHSAKLFRKGESTRDGADAARRKVQAMLALGPITKWVRTQRKLDVEMLNNLADRLAPVVLALISSDGQPQAAARLALPSKPAEATPSVKPATAADARALADRVRGGELDARLQAQLLRQLAILELLLDQPKSRAAATKLLAVLGRIHETGLQIAALPAATDRTKSLLTGRLTFAANRFGSRNTRQDGLRRLGEIDRSVARFAHLKMVSDVNPALGKTLAGHVELACVLLDTEDTRERGHRQHSRLWRVITALSRLYWATGRCRRANLSLGGYCRDADLAAVKLAATAIDIAIGKAGKDKKKADQWRDAIRPIEIIGADAAGVLVLTRMLSALGKDSDLAPRNRTTLNAAVGAASRLLLCADRVEKARNAFSNATAVAIALATLGRSTRDAALEKEARNLAGGTYSRGLSRARRAGRMLIEDFGKDRNKERNLARRTLFNFVDLRGALRAAMRLRAVSNAVVKVNRLRTWQFSTKDLGEAYKAVMVRLKKQFSKPPTEAGRREPDSLAGIGRLLESLVWILAHDGAVPCKDTTATRLAAAICLKLDPESEPESLRLQLGAYVNEGLARVLANDFRQASRYSEPAAETLAKLKAAMGE